MNLPPVLRAPDGDDVADACVLPQGHRLPPLYLLLEGSRLEVVVQVCRERVDVQHRGAHPQHQAVADLRDDGVGVGVVLGQAEHRRGLLDGQVAWMTYMASNYFATGNSPTRMGSKHPTIAPYQAFETADGYVVVACASENIWPRFCEAIEKPDLADDPRFASNADRVENRDELDPLLGGVFAELTTEDALDRLAAHDVPASDVKDMEAVFENPQVEARGMHQSVPHPTAGEVEMPGSPMHFSRTPTSIRQYPPRLGEHTDEVLGEYGYTDADIAELRDADALD